MSSPASAHQGIPSKSNRTNRIEPDKIRLVQNIRQLPSDMDTPISLFLRFAGDREAFLLESAEVDGRWGRYSVLGCDFACVFACREGKLCLDIRDKRLEALAVLDGLPFVEGLRAAMGSLELLPTGAPGCSQEELPPITRALYGYFGFESAALFNPKLAASFPQMTGQAEVSLVLPGTLLVFDHLYHCLSQLSLGEHRDFPLAAPVTANPNSLEAGLETKEVSDGQGPDSEQTSYENKVRTVRELLRKGEAIQVVPSARFSAPFAGDPFTLYRRMRRINASPYLFFMRLPEITLFGSSPEVMVRCSEGRLLLSPIAGTRRRGSDDVEDARLAAELRQDPKERAEHVMLVDLGRNDLGRIARAGSVKVERLMEVERFSHVMHLTSRVTARLNEGLDALDVLAATFPAGTVSGAPKIRAMEIIAQVEDQPRGPYAGCIGWLGLDAGSVNLDTGITIRSMWLRDGALHWQAGGGIVFDSEAEAEWKEVRNKAAIMRTVLGKS